MSENSWGMGILTIRDQHYLNSCREWEQRMPPFLGWSIHYIQFWKRTRRLWMILVNSLHLMTHLNLMPSHHNPWHRTPCFHYRIQTPMTGAVDRHRQPHWECIIHHCWSEGHIWHGDCILCVHQLRWHRCPAPPFWALSSHFQANWNSLHCSGFGWLPYRQLGVQDNCSAVLLEAATDDKQDVSPQCPVCICFIFA